MPRRELRTRRERRAIDRASQWRPQFVGQERRRIGHDVDNLGLNLRAVTTERDEVPDELVRELDRPAERHAKADEVFGVHGFRTNIPGGLKSEINVYSRTGNMCTRPQEGQAAPREACLSAHRPKSEKVKYENLPSPGCFPFHRAELGGRALLGLTVAIGLG